MTKYITHAVMNSKEALESVVLQKKNVVGVAVGNKISQGKETNAVAVAVLVSKKEPEAALAKQDFVPRSVNGVPTDVVEVGNIVALASRTDKWRPAPGGVSIGHYKITAGTLGAVVVDASTGKMAILSNNHVLANSNDASFGDPIYQPGPIDGGGPDDKIGTLLRFAPISFGEDEPTCDLAETYVRFSNWIAGVIGSSHRITAKRYDPQATNYVDCALAMPISQDVVTEEIIDLGVPSGTVEGYLGMKVAKSGRTTKTTKGAITYVNATIQVGYGAGKIATFHDQYLSGYMSQGGDSGSLLVTDEDNPKAVGLLFAGSDSTTVYNPIKHVISALNIII